MSKRTSRNAFIVLKAELRRTGVQTVVSKGAPREGADSWTFTLSEPDGVYKVYDTGTVKKTV